MKRNQSGSNQTGMFGDPIKVDQWMTILLPWVWARVNKEDPLTGGTIQKLIGSCNAMNGGPQYGAAITLTETDVMCVEQLVH